MGITGLSTYYHLFANEDSFEVCISHNYPLEV